MNRKRAILFVMAVIMAVGFIHMQACQKSYLDDYIPRVEIIGEPKVEEFKVTIDARLSNPKGHEINAYGFEWRKGNHIMGKYHADRPNFAQETFTFVIDYALKANDIYNVTAYVQRAEQTIYSEPVTFTAKGSLPPIVDEYFPTQGSFGDTLVILGSRFPSVNYSGIATAFLNYRVSVGTITAPVYYVSYDRIEAMVPFIFSGTSPFQIKLEVPGHSVVVGEFDYIR